MPTPIVELAEDTTIELVDEFTTGTVIWAVLRDGQGGVTHVSFDMREGSPTRYHFFAGARHPSKDWAVRVDHGSADEKKIVVILRRWLERGAGENAQAFGTWGKKRIETVLSDFETSRAGNKPESHASSGN